MKRLSGRVHNVRAFISDVYSAYLSLSLLTMRFVPTLAPPINYATARSSQIFEIFQSFVGMIRFGVCVNYVCCLFVSLLSEAVSSHYNSMFICL